MALDFRMKELLKPPTSGQDEKTTNSDLRKMLPSEGKATEKRWIGGINRHSLMGEVSNEANHVDITPVAKPCERASTTQI